MTGPSLKPDEELMRENEWLRAQLAEAESRLVEAQEVLRAIQSGEVDAVVVTGPEGDQVFTLKGAEYAYRALVEAMSEGAATLDTNGTVLYCNQRLADLLATPMEQIIGNPVTKLVSAETMHEFEALFACAQNSEACKAELSFQTGDNNAIPVYVSLREMKPVEQPALCMVVTDLTERKKRDELIATGRLANSILESAAEAVAVCDDTGMIMRVNQTLEDLCGSNPLYQNFNVALSLELSDDPTGQGKPFSIFDVLGGRIVRAQEVHLRRPDGQTAYLLLTAGPIKSSSTVVGCVLTLTDITIRKNAQHAVKRQADLLRLSFDAIIVWQLDGPVESWNLGAEQLYGYSEAEALGHITHELLRTIHSVPWPEIRAGLREQGNWEGELHQFTNDGRELVVSSRMQLIVGNDGIEKILETNRDITERKRTEEALIRSEKLASMGRMASTISHEINNPLETIGHALYLASTDADTSPQVKSYLDLASQELDRVTHITRQTLAFHRDSNAPKSIDLRESVDSIVRLFASRLKSREITIDRRYREVDPIRAFGGEIQQVISNLLSNSMDAVPRRGRIQLRVSRSMGKNGARRVRFTIADTGSGISPERQKRIFEPFFTTKELIGTGLGLWVTKQIVDKHKATIRVRSKPERGTVFSIAFPVAE